MDDRHGLMKVPSMSPSRQNVIWIFGDQHRAQATGYAGDPNVCTPNLDRLVTEGLNFENAVTNSPLCCPARGSLISGNYPQDAVDGHEVQLDPATPTIAHAFGQHGYHTAWFGKWHLDGFHENKGRAAFHVVPPERRGGFETWIGYENNNSAFDCWVHGHEEGREHQPYRLKGFETDALTDKFIAYLERRACGEYDTQPQPFFAALSVQPPHNPYVAPERWMNSKGAGYIEFRQNVPNIVSVRKRASQQLAGYYAAIENLDWNVGRVIEALERLDLYANTHVIFFSDHGDMHGSHGQFLKTSPYAESVNVPMIFGGIDHAYGIQCGDSPAPITTTDLAPTSLGLCGLPVPSSMSGRDLSGLRRCDGNTALPDSGYIQINKPTGHRDSIDRAWRGIVTLDRWKYVCLDDGNPWLMFNLNEDPYEQVNLAYNTATDKKRAELHNRLRQWIIDTGDTFTLVELS